MVASSVFKKSTRSMFTVSVLILNELTVSDKTAQQVMKGLGRTQYPG